MKIVNEKGKLFGIINIVDLAVLLVVLLLAYAAAVKFSGGEINTPITSSKKNVTITLMAQGVQDHLFSAFNKGDQLMYGNLFIDDAYIQNVVLNTSIINAALPTGKVITTEDPRRKDIYITFTASVDANSNVIKVGDSAIRVGVSYLLVTKNSQVSCTVTDIKYDK